MLRRPSRLALFLALALPSAALAAPPRARSQAAVPSAGEARRFLERADKELLELAVEQSRADWVAQNFITDDTEALSAKALKDISARTMELAAEATRYDAVALDPDLARRMKLLKLAAIPLPVPKDPAAQTELTGIVAWMDGAYGKGKYCRGGAGEDCLTINDITRVMATSRDEKELLDVWRGWHAVAPPIKPKYERFVQLANEGAHDLGYKDLGALWRSNYDMPPEQFAKEMDRLWTQVRPLYESLHAYVRARLVKQYGADKVPAHGPIPAHLLGNIWAQDWSNVYAIAAPPDADPGYDLDALLKEKGLDAKGIVKGGEGFFTSLGFAPLPATFWERSLFVKPRDREVVCHASAWDVDFEDDLRIKMCIEPTGEDFVTVHHELGHNFYQRAYKGQPFLYRNSANDGFHEAIGDTIALSVTPAYLKQIGLLDHDPSPGSDIGLLMHKALDKVAFLPFGLLVDQWRWKVFSGEVPPSGYNKAWWELRQKYQGVAAPVARSEADFDAGAKYHVPANVPYARYFIADILQFQFHRALCREAGFKGPLHQCSVYGNKEVGKRLDAMLAMGQSKPWPDALYAMTGEREMDATAILDYFAPLKTWLDTENAKMGVTPGWSE